MPGPMGMKAQTRGGIRTDQMRYTAFRDTVNTNNLTTSLSPADIASAKCGLVVFCPSDGC
jgi:hypothetical protein